MGPAGAAATSFSVIWLSAATLASDRSVDRLKATGDFVLAIFVLLMIVRPKQTRQHQFGIN